jgi:transposase-like protein
MMRHCTIDVAVVSVDSAWHLGLKRINVRDLLSGLPPRRSPPCSLQHNILGGYQMTNARKDETGSKAVGPLGTKQESVAPVPKDVKPEIKNDPPPPPSAATAPVPPLTQAANARAALDEASTAKIVEALKQPGANMTRIANEMGVNYNVVQSIKSKLQKASGSTEQRRMTTPKHSGVTAPVGDAEVQLLKLENDYLKRRLAILEGGK